MSRGIVVFVIAALFARAAWATVLFRENRPVPERHGVLLTTELLVSVVNVELGLENFAKGISEERSLAWGGLGIGVGALGMALSTRDKSPVPKVDLIAGAIGIAGGAFRIRGRYPSLNRVSFGAGQVRMRFAF